MTDNPPTCLPIAMQPCGHIAKAEPTTSSTTKFVIIMTDKKEILRVK